MNKSYFNLFALFILLLIVLFIISSKSKEGFLDTDVPGYCGTAGFRPSDATYSFFKSTYGADVSKKRMYTASECSKLDGGTLRKGSFVCAKLKDANKGTDDSNIDIDYTEQCGGLNNTVVSPAPTECMVDGVLAGKPNKAYSLMFGNKGEILVQDNTIQLYTNNECDLLKGTFTPLEKDLKNSNTSQELIAKAVAANGKDYGTCINTSLGLQYSYTCIINGKPTAAAKVSEAAKTAIKDWLS
jgi:hypothetical protein